MQRESLVKIAGDYSNIFFSNPVQDHEFSNPLQLRKRQLVSAAVETCQHKKTVRESAGTLPDGPRQSPQKNNPWTITAERGLKRQWS